MTVGVILGIALVGVLAFLLPAKPPPVWAGIVVVAVLALLFWNAGRPRRNP